MNKLFKYQLSNLNISKVNLYNCINISIKSYFDVDNYSNNIINEINDIKSQNIKAIWLKLDKNNFDKLNFFNNIGFELHHVEDKDTIVMLQKIEKNSEIPNYPSTNIAGSGLIIHNNQIVVLKEKYNLGFDVWKFPGGTIDKNEYLVDGIKREIQEETGLVDLKYKGLLIIRELYKKNFNLNDMFFVSVFKMDKLQILKKQESEILYLKYMDMSEYLNLNYGLPLYKETCKFLKKYIENEKESEKYLLNYKEDFKESRYYSNLD